MHYGEMHRFLGALIVRLGKSVAEVQVRHHPRRRGRSKYSFLSLIGLYLDFVTTFPTRIFQIVTLAGLLCTMAGLGLGFLYFPLRFPPRHAVRDQNPIPDFLALSLEPNLRF